MQYYLVAAGAHRSSQPVRNPRPAPVAVRSQCGSRSQRGVRGRSPGPQPAARNSRGVLIDTSIYLEPTELVDVALYVLARLAPCLNLGVGELGHKDLLDTISADNRRK